MTAGKLLLLPLGVFAVYMIADTMKFKGNHSNLRGGAVKRGLAIGPPWTRGEMEAPRGEKDMGGWTASVFDEEQQERLGIDEMGIPLDGSENAVTETNMRNEEIAKNMQQQQDDWGYDPSADWDDDEDDDDWEIVGTDDGSMPCPAGCTEWFDGCNTCGCDGPGQITACTEMWCSMPETPQCYSWDGEDMEWDMYDTTTTSPKPLITSDPMMMSTTTPLPRMCCRAMTADCMSCSLGVTVEEYCGSNPDTVGCGTGDMVQIDDGPMMLGGNQDDNGCILDAGYEWCESKGYCLRSWEEDCPNGNGEDVQACPEGCTTWFDGCNTCTCNGVGQVGGCTRMFCSEPETPQCYGFDEEAMYENNPSTSDTSDTEVTEENKPTSSLEGSNACCKAMTVDCMACANDMSNEEYCGQYPDTVGCDAYTPPAWETQLQQQAQLAEQQAQQQGGLNGQPGTGSQGGFSDGVQPQQQACPPGCTSWFDGCNTCTCDGEGQVGGCTMMMCFQSETPQCYAYGED